MSAYGFSDKACKLISSYLSDRKQRVKISGEVSDWSRVNKGVPQGSKLGPQIFNLFLNDLAYFIPKECLSSFADDNTLVASAENPTTL